MTGSGTRLEDRLARALTAMPEPAIDVRAARDRFQRRTHRATRNLRMGVVVSAAVVAVVLAVAVAVAGHPLARTTMDDPVAPRRLASGLPIGFLHGTVYYTDTAHGVNGPASFHFVVGPGGRGTFAPPHSGGESWPVRFVGTTAGRVVIRRDDSLCGLIDDLTLDFTVRDSGFVEITGAMIDRCSVWPKIAGTSSLPGTVMAFEGVPPR